MESHVVGVVFPRSGPGGGDPQEGQEGGTRVLGIPNVVDRVAQTAAAMALEPSVEQVFHDDSYGYRPGRSPVDAVAVCRERCFRRDWVVDLDIRAFFDSVPWDLMLKAVARHTDQKWVVLYVERWLKAPMLMSDGTLVPRVKGTPQGSPISPLIANLFLHYGFDAWMVREFPAVQFERFADDVVIHCVSERQARQVRDAIASSARRGRVGAAPRQDEDRVLQGQQSPRELRGDLVHVLRLHVPAPEGVQQEHGGGLHGLPPGGRSGEADDDEPPSCIVAASSAHDPDPRRPRSRRSTPSCGAGSRYFTAFYPSAVIPLCQRIDRHLVRWARRKYKRLERSGRRARAWLRGVRSREPELFVHWRYCGATP